METNLFDYPLPEELIALKPTERRDESRLMAINREPWGIRHQKFPDIIDHFKPGDVLVLNDTKVIPARVRGTKPDSGGQIEILLLEETQTNEWWSMLKPGKRVREGSIVQFHDRNGIPSGVSATVLEKNVEGHCRLSFSGCGNILDELDQLGEIPLPPYISREADYNFDSARYQTVYSDKAGSVAAPTAGLHFTDDLLTRIRKLGVEICHVTLHVGYGTFAPVKVESIEDHRMHSEVYEISESTAEAINLAKRENRRVIAVGTTSLRVLESAVIAGDGKINSGKARTSIFIYPPYEFKIVDALLTNFHLPKSTLLMLVSAFASSGSDQGIDRMLSAYAEAIEQKYRFFSYGDAMLLI